MSFTIITWGAIGLFICLFIFLLSAILIAMNKINPPFPQFLIIEFAVCFFIILGVMYILECSPIKSLDMKKIYLTNYKNEIVYRELKEVRTSINNGYGKEFDKLDYNTYRYDYLEVTLADKPINFLELKSYMKNKDYNLVYNSQNKLHKVTKSLKLEGVLKTNIKEGVAQYLIGSYTLSNDEKNTISSLANNQKVILDIVYNEDVYKNDKIISEYIIVNAKTIQ